MNDDANAGQGSQHDRDDAGGPRDTIGHAYFYNMTTQSAWVEVNDFPANGFSAPQMPDPPGPYTPTAAPTAGLTRYQGAAQGGQFGIDNTVVIQFSGQTDGITVKINVNFSPYPITKDILIYIFYNSVVVAVSTDNNAYLGQNGDTISVDPSNQAQKI